MDIAQGKKEHYAEHTEAIFSKAADKLSVPEKVIYLFEMDLEKEYYVDNDGKIKKLDETV